MSDSTGSIYYQDDFVTLYLGDCLTQTAWLDADAERDNLRAALRYREEQVTRAPKENER